MAGGVISTVKTMVHVAAVVTWYFACTVMMGASAGTLLGFDNGIMGGVIAHPDFIRKFINKGASEDGHHDSMWCKFDDAFVQLFVSALFLTGMLGALLGIPLSNCWGRRSAMMLGGLAFMAGSALLASAFSWPQLVAGRLVLGLGVGLATQSTPLYLMEMSPPQWRGAVNIMFQLCITVGILLAQVLNFFVAPLDYGWRIALGAGAVPAAVLFFGSMLLPETPQWLVSKGQVDKATAVARKCFGVDDVSAVIKEMQLAADANSATTATGKAAAPRPSGMRLLFTRRYLPQLVMATVIPVAQQLTGINGIIFFAPQVFVAAGQSATNALLSAVVIGLVNVAATGVAAVAVDRVGRRFLLLQGGAQMVVTQVAVGVMLKSLDEGGGSQAMGVALVALTSLYVSGFAWSWGPLGWLVPTEIQPLETRPAGTALNACVNFAGTFLISQVFLSMLCGLKWGVFFFFAGCVLLACLFVFFLLPETKGLNEEEMAQAIAAHKVWGPVTGTADTLPLARSG